MSPCAACWVGARKSTARACLSRLRARACRHTSQASRSTGREGGSGGAAGAPHRLGCSHPQSHSTQRSCFPAACCTTVSPLPSGQRHLVTIPMRTQRRAFCRSLKIRYYDNFINGARGKAKRPVTGARPLPPAKRAARAHAILPECFCLLRSGVLAPDALPTPPAERGCFRTRSSALAVATLLSEEHTSALSSPFLSDRVALQSQPPPPWRTHSGAGV